MNDLWLKKNPFMSIWLSGVGKVMGVARRQTGEAVIREGSRARTPAPALTAHQVTGFWTHTVAKPPSGLRKRRTPR